MRVVSIARMGTELKHQQGLAYSIHGSSSHTLWWTKIQVKNHHSNWEKLPKIWLANCSSSQTVTGMTPEGRFSPSDHRNFVSFPTKEMEDLSMAMWQFTRGCHIDSNILSTTYDIFLLHRIVIYYPLYIHIYPIYSCIIVIYTDSPDM